MGFCLTNHVAVAAEHARSRGAGRVAILDWDVHHGNGTQDIFYESGRGALPLGAPEPLLPRDRLDRRGGGGRRGGVDRERAAAGGLGERRSTRRRSPGSSCLCCGSSTRP